MMKRILKKKKYWITGFIVLAILGTAGFFIYKWYFKSADEKSPRASSHYIAFARGRIDVEGSIVKLSASKDGILKELYVEEGQKVKKGQILCKQDDRKEKLNWELCKAEAALAKEKIDPLQIQLDAAKREFKRYEGLIKNEAISQQKWDEAKDLVDRITAELEVSMAEANVAQAKQNQAEYDMELKTIRAPADGKILRCDARPGYGISTLNVTVLFLFVPDAPFIVRSEIEEKFVKSVKPGTPAEIVPDANETKTYKGTVIKMGNYLGPKRQVLDEPQEKNDVRTTECILSITGDDLILGQRVLVKFKKK